jgi:uncharacterized protein YqeY
MIAELTTAELECGEHLESLVKENEMTVIEKLKTESINLRKTRNPIAASITFALSEIEKIGKNNGNRETTEDEAIRVIQKIISTIDENLKLADESKSVQLNYEKTILSSVLPRMASDEEVETFLKNKYAIAQAASDMPNKGVIMKSLREEFGSLVDMKRAGVIVSEMYGV